jgi:hypothetical protein
VRVPTGIVALDDDPMHPAAVAELWSHRIPNAQLAHVPFEAPAADRAVLGRTALSVWRDALSASR